MGAVLARDEWIIRCLFRRGIGAMVAVRASLRGVDDRRYECRFAGMTDRNTVRRRCDNRGEIGAMCVSESSFKGNSGRQGGRFWCVMPPVEVVIRHHLRSEMAAVIAVRASLRGVDDRRWTRRFEAKTERWRVKDAARILPWR